ncbi:septum formation inhibitor Maf [candidate division KSB3 bacterium]|uniref:dTTP/UTP pyrophosphatase n=1 Tax=candidate division KSB3 bacterium TaxID=2044937 RepID=A0A9D5JUS6_9BACT|nr:septum formation inhibitor Maf [candidate division KSB3 bacterium]MBD3324653.1 septum formation inhibitor Maf [candidate division KSB3 bacterium]
MPRIILASSSPRRKMLLSQIGVPFEVVASDVDEHVDQRLPPVDVARQLALRKAQAVAASHADALVVGADTIVVDEEGILGKPRHADEAFQMLSRLSGKVHRVITGLALIATSPSPATLVQHETTQVKMTTLSRQEISRYIDTGEPLDKAGAYAIQGRGAAFIEWIHGCYPNVVGLPLFRFLQMVKQMTPQVE